jgi:hypothetical protein
MGMSEKVLQTHAVSKRNEIGCFDVSQPRRVDPIDLRGRW